METSKWLELLIMTSTTNSKLLMFLLTGIIGEISSYVSFSFIHVTYLMKYIVYGQDKLFVW